MLVCVPTKNNTGMDAIIHDHFGSAPYFTLINTENEELKVLENNNAHHSHGTCHPMNQLAHYKIDAVLCAGMGRRAVEALNAEGIKTMASNAGNVREAIKQLTEGTISEIDPNKACRGHGQGTHHDISETGSGRGSGFGRGGGLGAGLGSGFGPKSGVGRKRNN